MLMTSDMPLKKLCSKSTSQSAIRTANGCPVSDADGQMVRWAEHFEQLFTVDPPSGQLQTVWLQMLDADPPIDVTAPSIGDVKEAVAKIRQLASATSVRSCSKLGVKA